MISDTLTLVAIILLGVAIQLNINSIHKLSDRVKVLEQPKIWRLTK